MQRSKQVLTGLGSVERELRTAFVPHLDITQLVR